MHVFRWPHHCLPATSDGHFNDVLLSIQLSELQVLLVIIASTCTGNRVQLPLNKGMQKTHIWAASCAYNTAGMLPTKHIQHKHSPTATTTTTATQMAMPSIHSPSLRCSSSAAPSTVETPAQSNRNREKVSPLGMSCSWLQVGKLPPTFQQQQKAPVY